MEEPENTFEFKQARDSYPFEKLKEYCVALANEGGGKLIFGVTDQRPREVVGSHAFMNAETIEGELCREFGCRFDFQEIEHANGRVLVLHIPSLPFGRPLAVRGRYLRRAGESLVPMDALEITRLTQRDHDFSAQLCIGSSFEDLDALAVDRFRILLEAKSPSLIRTTLSSERLLNDYSLLDSGRVTYAALLLLGKPDSLNRLLPQAELIFEYRSDESDIRHEQRVEYRAGFLLWYQQLWEVIDRRNGVQFVQDGFVNRSIRTFTETVVREAVLNAVCHRDYQVASSAFVKQDSRSLEVVSPGGFPDGITPDTVLMRQHPRNRRLAEALQHCGLIERSGQGVDLMFSTSLREGKQKPDYHASDHHEVRLRLRGEIQNPQFIRFLEKVGQETGIKFRTEDLIVLDCIARSENIPFEFKERLEPLVDEGIIERIGRGRGVRLLLSRRFYAYLGRPGLYTAKLGLDRQANKALLLEHIQHSGKIGAALMELQQVLPASSREMIKVLLLELRTERKIVLRGANRGARYFASPVEI